MSELGRISSTADGSAQATLLTRNRMLRSTKLVPANIPDDDAAAATIRNAHSPQGQGTHQGTGMAEPPPTRVEMIRDFLDGVEARVARLIELVNRVADGSFSYHKLQQEAEALGVALAKRWKQAPLAFSQVRLDSASRSSAVPRSFHSKAAAVMEFHSDQISEIESSLAERRAVSEVDVFSLARVRERAMKVLRCQDIEPDRVLFLLRDDVFKPNTNGR